MELCTFVHDCWRRARAIWLRQVKRALQKWCWELHPINLRKRTEKSWYIIYTLLKNFCALIRQKFKNWNLWKKQARPATGIEWVHLSDSQSPTLRWHCFSSKANFFTGTWDLRGKWMIFPVLMGLMLAGDLKKMLGSPINRIIGCYVFRLLQTSLPLALHRNFSLILKLSFAWSSFQ